MHRRAIGLAALLGLVVPLGLAAPAQAAGPAVPYDFDGDGRPELAVGAPGLRVGSVRQAGGVVVLRSSRTGLTTKEAKVVTQSSAGVPGASEEGDGFGSAVTSADFNRDGYADLAVGQPGEAVGSDERAGGATVVLGSGSGLRTRRSTSIRLPGSVELGAALAAGDLTGDGYPDLAVGSPGEDSEDSANGDYGPRGVVHVLPGSPDGVDASEGLVLRGVRTTGTSGFDVGFGSRLAVGDLNRDGIADLVVVSEGARFIDEGYPGSVSVCLGAKGGPTGCSRLTHEEELAEADAVGVGNVSGSATPEVVVGAGSAEEDDQGKVAVLQLQDADPRTVATQTFITPDSPGIPHGTGFEEGFGTSVAVGDLDRDGYADLVVGTKDTSTGSYRGRVTVVHGAASGYRTTGNRIYDQASKGVPGKSEDGDRFGGAVTLLDHDADGHLDLAVGAPGEDDDDGAVTTLRGSGTGFTTRGARSIKLSTLDYAHPHDAYFGDVLGQ